MKASTPCVVKNGYCISHRHAIRDGGVACGVRRDWEKTQATCHSCGKLTPCEETKSLHGKFLKYRKLGKLEHSFICELELADMEFWTAVNACPEDQGICPECVDRVMKILRGDQVCTRLPDYAFELVPVFRFLIPRKAAAPQESEPTKPADDSDRIAAIRFVADKILGRKSIRYADKELGYGGRGTECIVAANDPSVCREWCDWSRMPTLNRPNADGRTGRGHCGLCPKCADVLVNEGYKLGPSLYECITGKKPMRMPDNVVSIGTPLANAATAKTKRTLAEQKARKATRAEAYKAAYPPGPARSNDSVVFKKKNGGKK